jgi:hypothetical protein
MTMQELLEELLVHEIKPLLLPHALIQLSRTCKLFHLYFDFKLDLNKFGFHDPQLGLSSYDQHIFQHLSRREHFPQPWYFTPFILPPCRQYGHKQREVYINDIWFTSRATNAAELSFNLYPSDHKGCMTNIYTFA